MASLGIRQAEVYRRVIAGIISTGDEVTDLSEPLKPGMIRNSNRYTIAAALESIGIDTVYLGHAGDDKEETKKLILLGEAGCDVVVSTGGVSAGEYDLVPDAMEAAGYELLVRGVDIKPGMACAYGVKDNMIMLALSGNPASSLTNLQCVCYPALRKLMGMEGYGHELIKMKIGNDFLKKSKGVRFIRGTVKIEKGNAVFRASGAQGNVVISSTIGCNAYGIITDKEGSIKAGTMIDGFLVNPIR
jgi:molybdopterin molybdotransferase